MKEIYVVTSGEYLDHGYGEKEKIQNSLDEINDLSMWPKENPNIDHAVSYETYQNDILAKRFGIPRKEKTMAIMWHPCRYIDSTLEHDGSWIDGKWYEWEDIHGNREIARMKLDSIDHFYPETKTVKEEDVCRYREIEEGE